MTQPAVQPHTSPAINPVCGMKVAGAQSCSAFAGTTYYFCCDGCRALLAANPAKYIKAASKPVHHGAAHHARPTPAITAPDTPARCIPR